MSLEIRQNVLDYITTNLPDYKTWIEDKYSVQGYTLSDFNYVSIFDTMDCQLPALLVLDAGKSGGEPIRTNSTVARNVNIDIYVIDRVIDQAQAEVNISMYQQVLEQMFVDLYNDNKNKRIEGLRNVLLETWTPYDANINQGDDNDTYKIGIQSITGLSQIFGRG